MSLIVTSGAMLRCTFGSQMSPMVLSSPGNVQAGGRQLAVLTDLAPITASPHFGQCASPANPTWGVHHLGDCTPLAQTPWAPPSATVFTKNLPVINMGSQCMCRWGGIITVQTAAQNNVSAG